MQVKGANKDGVWSRTFANLSITIRPSWWLSILAKCGYVLGGILLKIGINRIRIQKFKKQKLVLEQKVADRTEELVTQKERSDQLLLNNLPRETAEELKLHGKARAKSYELVTVLFTDFKDFTKYSEKYSPEELVEQIDYCYQAFDNIMERINMEKIKTIGDAYMAVGGLPKVNRSNPKDAVRDFMIEYQRARRSEGLDTWQIRVSLHTGDVVAGIIGTKKFAYDIWGDIVNTASHIEHSSQVGKVNISQTTFEQIKDDPEFIFFKGGKIQVKGKSDMEMHFVELAVSE